LKPILVRRDREIQIKPIEYQAQPSQMSLNHEDSPQRFFDEIDDKPAVFPSQASPSGRIYSNGSPTTKKLIKSQSLELAAG